MEESAVRFETRGGLSTLTSELRLDRDIDEVFPFFADARNLEELTPAFIRFRILTPNPLEMRAGLQIDYRLRLLGVPFRWRSEITAWEPPRRFVDEQLRGPYRVWIHEHTFESIGGSTLVTDLVRYDAPGGSLVERAFVRPRLRRIFAYRRKRLREIFA